MNTLTIHLKNKEKKRFILDILKQFDFLTIEGTSEIKQSKIVFKHDFFASSGNWDGRYINQEDLRKKAWKN